MLEQGGGNRPKLLARMVLRRRLTTRRAALIIGGYTVSISLEGRSDKLEAFFRSERD